ncbi:hypothetical protein GCT13_29470 [Paraburkholderia sp. CNPSo 3157]|uniref:Uncharacterized protein n=1 Tax=Paraburkholderia franconis TaxID=2654983 RepID=A0A7X1NF90_9BURK|nr:hypothetical protein [Paraburkholderia franconis]MPW20887.1 hypothetical protein [Paraburkholderia franconis]
MSRAAMQVHEAGEALNKRAGNAHEMSRCRMKDGDVESPWVIVKHWRCEPAFFAYFLCGGKESECRPAQGQRPRREAQSRMPAIRAKQTTASRMPAIRAKQTSVADKKKNTSHTDK